MKKQPVWNKGSQRITVDAPQLWSEHTPVLYTCVSRLYEKQEEKLVLLDDNRETFGIRTIQVDARSGFGVNGETVNLRGGCIHHDSGLLGAATYEDAQYRQVRKMKEAGFNAIRMSHHLMAPAMLRACVLTQTEYYSDNEMVENLMLDLHLQYALRTTSFEEKEREEGRLQQRRIQNDKEKENTINDNGRTGSSGCTLQSNRNM